MRIVEALGWYLPESTGGTEVYVAGLVRRLRDLGHTLHVVVPEAGRARASLESFEGTPVLRYPIPRHPLRAEARGEVPARGSEALGDFLRDAAPDVVHAHTLKVGLGLDELEAARQAGARVFVTAHESRLGYLCQRGSLMRWGSEPCDGLVERKKCAACSLQQRGLARPIARALAAIPAPLSSRGRRVPGPLGTALSMGALIDDNLGRQRRLLSLVEKLVVLTEAARKIARANGAPPDKLVLNRLGFGSGPATRKPARATSSPVTIGYLGRFDRVKGLAVLAAALARIPREIPLRVELRGPVRSDEERAVVAEIAALAGGDPRLSFQGAVLPEHAAEALAGYDVLCCPSLCLEGGPTVALEAFAVGTPVIGSRIGGLAELVDDRWGRLVAPGDVDALAGLLRAIAEDPGGTVDVWRAHLPAARTMDDVTRDTLAMYEA